MVVVAFLVFASALAASLAVLWSTLAPALPRIVAILRDGVDPVAAQRPLAIVSEPHLRERIRTAMPAVQPEWRAAA